MTTQLFKRLPSEIIRYISSFIENIVYRNGVYIVRINQNDFRYELIENIVKPSFIYTGFIIKNLIVCTLKLSPNLSKFDNKDFCEFLISYTFDLETRHHKYVIHKTTNVYYCTVNGRRHNTRKHNGRHTFEFNENSELMLEVNIDYT